MPTAVSSQAYIFLCSVLAGMAITLIYDLFRIKRKAIKTSGLVTHIEDFAFWLLVAIIMLGMTFYSNEGEIRGYIVLGTIIGAILYTLLFSRIIISSSMFIINIIKTIIKFIWTIISWPFKILFKILYVPAKLIGKTGKKTMRSVKRMTRNRGAKAAIWKKVFKNFRKKI